MDFRSLRYFVTVAEELNFTQAAKRLHMSQPPLSSQIRDMELDLGTDLFIRGKRHLQLTEAGRILYRRAQQMIELAEKTREEIEALGNELAGKICIGLVEGRAPFLAARWIAGFQEEFPRVRYEMWNGSSDDVVERLQRGLADVAVIAAPYDREHLEGFPVGEEPWIAIIPASHPLAEDGDSPVELKALAGENLILPQRKSRVEAIERWFAGVGGEVKVLCNLSNYLDAVALVEQNAGIAIFPQTTYTPNRHVVSRVIINPAKRAEYVLVWNRGQMPAGVAGEFIRYVQDFMEEDRIHQERFRVREHEFTIPEGASIL